MPQSITDRLAEDCTVSWMRFSRDLVLPVNCPVQCALLIEDVFRCGFAFGREKCAVARTSVVRA